MIDRLNFSSPEDLASALAADVSGRLSAAISRKGTAILAVSGGSTPRRFFQALSRLPIDWQNVVCTLVDERWVPKTDSRSNAALVQENLLQGKAAEAKFLPLYSGDEDPESGLPSVRNKLEQLPRPFDVVILGMGTDGHTASFFPGGDNLQAALDPGAGPLMAMRAPGAGEPRITLTLPALLDAEYLVLHIEGAEKAKVLEHALTPGPVEEMPIRAILNQGQTDLTIYSTP